MKVALCQWNALHPSNRFTAVLKTELPNGDWIAISRDETSRFHRGGEVLVQKSEILDIHEE